MEISASKSISFFGWWDQPRTILCWEDVKGRCLSWRKLRDTFQFTAEELRTLQPDKGEWIKRGALTLHDMGDMAVFPINPITDMHADLAEVWSMHWTPEQLGAMGVTFVDMKACGLTSKIMSHFGFSLRAWAQLGFEEPHARSMSEDESTLVFGMSSAEVCSVLGCRYIAPVCDGCREHLSTIPACL